MKTIKKFLKTILNYLKINFRKTITPGFSIFNYNFFFDEKSDNEKFRGMHALNYVKKFNPLTFLDVGSGGGYHAKEMMINGSKVTCIDYGKSIYSKETKIDNLKIINIDFNKFKPPDQEKYEMVWHLMSWSIKEILVYF